GEGRRGRALHAARDAARRGAVPGVERAAGRGRHRPGLHRAARALTVQRRTRRAFRVGALERWRGARGDRDDVALHPVAAARARATSRRARAARLPPQAAGAGAWFEKELIPWRARRPFPRNSPTALTSSIRIPTPKRAIRTACSPCCADARRCTTASP